MIQLVFNCQLINYPSLARTHRVGPASRRIRRARATSTWASLKRMISSWASATCRTCVCASRTIPTCFASCCRSSMGGIWCRASCATIVSWSIWFVAAWTPGSWRIWSRLFRAMRWHWSSSLIQWKQAWDAKAPGELIVLFKAQLAIKR